MHDQEQDPCALRDLSESALERRLDELMHALGEGPEADDRRALILDLQAHRVELEMQSRELRAAQQALELSRDHYARLFDLAPVGYALFDRRGRILDINLTAARLVGQPRARLIGASFAGLLAPGDMRAFLGHVRHMCNSGAPERGDTRAIVLRQRADGGARVLRVLSSPREGEAGRACFSALLDITAEDAAERQRRESDRLRQAVLDALPAEVAVLDGEGRIVAVNAHWRRFAEENGAPAALREGVGIDDLDVCGSLQAEESAEADSIADGLAAVLTGRAPGYSTEYPCHAPERPRWFALTVAPLAEGETGAVVVRFEITNRKLADDRARRTRDQAAQAARINAVGVLAASLIHEITQPLSAAGFFSGTAVSLLEQGAAAPDQLGRVLTGVDQQIRRAADILERLREFLRSREIHMQSTPIDAIVAQAMGLVRWFATDRQVRLTYARPAPGVEVMADTLQIGQVLVNLVCNGVQAIEAAKSARREVAIAVDPRPNGVEVSVRDTGPGIPAEVRTRLFDIFASTREAGLGMGLAISRDIVETHGGKLWADPDVSEGALFRFTLPPTRPGGKE
jgi:PAS domain S-box-containing protein